MNRWLNVGVSGNAGWPREETELTFGGHKFVLKPATATTDQSVHVCLNGISDTNALTLINRFLSILSWCDGQAMENLYGWSGNPKPVPVPKARSGTGSSIAFPFNREPEQDTKKSLALALYREGLTINSTPFQFLSYFKILNVFWADKFSTINGKRINPIVEGIRSTISKLTDPDTKKLINDLSKTHSDVAQYLYESGRCAVAHAYSAPVVDPDDIEDLRRLSQDIEIIRGIAELLIENDMQISRSIAG